MSYAIILPTHLWHHTGWQQEALLRVSAMTVNKLKVTLTQQGRLFLTQGSDSVIKLLCIHRQGLINSPCLCVWVCAWTNSCEFRRPQSPNKGIWSSGREVGGSCELLSQHVGAEHRTQVLCKRARAPTHWAVSLSLPLIFF